MGESWANGSRTYKAFWSVWTGWTECPIMCCMILWFWLNTIVNLALDRRAIQSSTKNRAFANLAIDGDVSSNIELCSRTSAEDNPWWVVDLEETFVVTFVRITNSVQPLMDAEIRVGNKGNINKLWVFNGNGWLVSNCIKQDYGGLPKSPIVPGAL